MMRKTLIACLVALALPAVAQWAYRVPCELQSRDLPAALKTLTWQQGTTPLIQLDLLNNGKPQAVDTNAQAVLIFGPAATSSYFVATTNTVATGTYYQVQLPTIGTNTAGAAWWYTVYFEVNGLRYWTGNGEVYIEATTSTADGLEWQQLTTSGQVAAEAVLRVAGDLAGSNYADAVSTAAQSAAQAYAGTLMQTGTAARATSADYATVAGTATNATYATSSGTANLATNATILLGDSAWFTMSGTTGLLYKVTATDTNVIRVVSHSQDYNGPSGPFEGPLIVYDYLSWGGTIWWNSAEGYSFIGSTWVGTTSSLTLPATYHGDEDGLYSYGSVTIDWGLATNAYAIATTADLDAALAAYSTNGHGHAIADVTGLQDALDSIPDEAEIESIAEAAASAALATIPSAGCTDLSTSTNVTVTGMTVTYAAAPSGPYTIGIATNAPRYAYAIEIAGTNAASFAAGITLRGDWTPSGTNLVVLYPGTGTLYRAAGRAY
jgi:hypothetical protein